MNGLKLNKLRMEQELLKYIGIYKFPIGEEPVLLISDSPFKVESLYKEGKNLVFKGSFNTGDGADGYFFILNADVQKIIYDRFNELN